MNKPKRKDVTIHDIARIAVVSPSTVSRVLNQTTPVAEDKRNAVLAAMHSASYQPSVLAQSLAWGRSMAIGVLAPSVASAYYGEILKGVEEGLRGSNYHAVYANGNWHVEDEVAALDLISRRVDGLIILGGFAPDQYLRDLAKQLPLVTLGRPLEGMEGSCLRVDHVEGARRATKHLIELGHTRVAHIAGAAGHPDAAARHEGYRLALVEHNLKYTPELVVAGDFSEQSGVMAIEALLGRATLFSAVFAANDQMAYGARLALFRRGIRVPDEVSLVGFDDLPGSRFTTPPLTTVRQPTVDMGATLGRAVLNMLQGRPAELSPITPTLVIRETTAWRR